MSVDVVVNKYNLDTYLSKLAREYRRINGDKIKAEIVLIGGASIILNYGFRESTYDIDAIIQASSAMKEAINQVGDELGLPNGWLNSDFMKTKSYSSKLVQYSKFYKQFCHVLNVRTVAGEYLLAMKLISSRQFKNDISDIIGIICEEKKLGHAITLNKVETAITNLYGSMDVLSLDSKKLIQELLNDEEIEKKYEMYRIKEKNTRNALIEFQEQYEHVLKESNANEIIKTLQKRKNI